MATKRTGQNLVELRTGYWKITVNIPASSSPDGKRHRRVAYVTGGIRKAEAKRRDLLGLRDQGKLKPRTAGTVAEFMGRYLRAKKPNVAVRTHRRWESLLKNQITPHVGAKLLRDVQPMDLRALYAELQADGLSGTTVHKVHSLLSMAFRQAVIDGDMPLNPCSAVAAPKTDTPEASALDEKQANALLVALADSPLYVPVLVALDCGLRRGELLALRWTDLDVEPGCAIVRGAVEEDGSILSIRTTKTRRVRTVRLTRRVIAALVEHRKAQTAMKLAVANFWVEQGLVFPATDAHRGKLAGRIWRPSSFSRVFREQTRAAGFTIGLHTLRHTHATAMLRAGVDSKVVSERLGHSTTHMTTEIYQHVLPDQQQDAVDAYERRMEEAE
jgi:integrase